MSTTYANAETGELSSVSDIKLQAAEAAQALVGAIWSEVCSEYNLAPLSALGVAKNIANAVLAGAVKEAVDILAEPFKPQQRKLPGMTEE